MHDAAEMGFSTLETTTTTTALLGAFKRHLSQLNDDPTQLLKNQEQQLL